MGSGNRQTTPATTSTSPGPPTTGRRQRTNGTRRNQHSPGAPTTRLRKRGNDSSKDTGRSGRQKAATRRSTRREDRVTVHGPVKNPQPNGMSHRGVPPPPPPSNACLPWGQF